MNIRIIITIAIAMGALTSCSLPHTDLKSPCVGLDDSPCGVKRPVNDWWLKGQGDPA